MKILDVLSAPWAIRTDSLLEIQSIAAAHQAGQKIDIEAVEARIGRPLANTRAVTVRGETAMIPITGPVFRYANLMTEISGATSLQVLATDFAAADSNPAIRNIVLVIDSPGGQANGIAEFAQLVRGASKPVIAYIDNTAASAAYWIAAAAGQVVMSKTAMVGSIGAVVSIDTRKDGDRVEIVSSQSPNKRSDVTTDAGRAEIQTLIDGLAQLFIDDVAAYRRTTADNVVAKFGGGSMKLAAEAVALGMADRIGTLETLLADLAGKTQPNKGPRMPETNNTPLTLESLRASHPALVATLLAEGAAAERSRIAAVEAQSLPGHEALIAQLKADGTSTGGDAAMQVLAAERGKLNSMAAKLHADAPAAVPHVVAPLDQPPEKTDNRQALHDKAKSYQAQHPGISYMAALIAVSSPA